MNLWNRLFGNKPPNTPEPAPAEVQPHLIEIVIIFDESPASGADLIPWQDLQEEIDAALRAADAGEVDGDLWGQGQCTVYCYGPNAQRMWEAIAPVIEPHPIPRGSYALKHFRGPGPHRTERVNLHWDG